MRVAQAAASILARCIATCRSPRALLHALFSLPIGSRPNSGDIHGYGSAFKTFQSLPALAVCEEKRKIGRDEHEASGWAVRVYCRGRREKAPVLSGCESRPATVAPAGSSRSGWWREPHRLKHADDNSTTSAPRPAPRGRRPRRWLAELGDRQHQPHQVHLPGDWQSLVDLLQVPVDGIFRETHGRGHGSHAPALRQPDRHLTLRRCQSQRPGDHGGIDTRMVAAALEVVEC